MAENKPKATIHFDKFDAEADTFFEEFQKTGKLEFLLKAANLYKKSSNPEREEIHSLLKGIYYKKRGETKKELAKAISDFKRSVSLFKKIFGIESNEVINLKIEILKKELLSEKGNKEALKKNFLNIAKLYSHLKNEKEFNANMALHYLYSLTEYELTNDKLLETAELMVKHAEMSGISDIYYKTKGLYHQIKARTSYNASEAQKEFEEALVAIGKTSDKHGKNQAEAELLFSKAMSAGNKKTRENLFRKAGRKWLEVGDRKNAERAINMLSPLPIKVMALQHYIEDAIKKQNELTKLVKDLTKTTSPNVLFYHSSYLIEKLKDFKLIMRRLGESRKKITELNFKRDKLEPKKRFKKNLSKRLQRLSQEQSELTHLMRLDLESLYVFGKILLDQWAFMIGHLLGYKTPKEFNFDRLYNVISGNGDKGLFQEVLDKHGKDIFWLYYQLKAYRNEFIEHVSRPWQKGSTMSVYGDDFNLFIPTPPGWISDDELAKKLKSVRHLMPKVLKDMPNDYWEKNNPKRVLEVTFWRIDEIKKKADREKVWDVWKTVGGSTLSYDKIASRLINFIWTSATTLSELTKNNPSKIILGEQTNRREKVNA